MTLRELVESVVGVRASGPGWEGTVCRGIALHSEAVHPGDLFCAVAGTQAHGIRYWPEAQRRGAVAILTDTEVPVPEDVPTLRAGDVRRVLPFLAAALWGHPGERLQLAGVTGSNGKTTTATMLAQILGRAGYRAGLWSTAWVSMDGTGFRPAMTTPEAPELQRFLASALQAEATHAVLEVSSHAVALNRIGGLSFQVGIATNLSPDHLDFHGSYEAYRAAKQAFIAALRPAAVAVLNADDPAVREFAQATKARVRWFGFQGGCDASADAIENGLDGVRFRVRLAGRRRSLPVHLPLLGTHNVLNALAAILAADALGVDPVLATDALHHFVPPVRRLEPMSVGPYTIINDVAMNQASYEAVLGAMDGLGRPLVVVNAVRGNRGTAVNRDIGRILGRWNARLQFAPLIACTSAPQLTRLPVDYRVRSEELEAFIEGARDEGLRVVLHDDLAQAIEEALSRLGQDGVLLLLGTFGMDDGPALAVNQLAVRLGVPRPRLDRAEQRAYGGKRGWIDGVQI
jgi:UDP-N-acetylmuramoyl-L-alanyl-D-glutamate--2,6-diaminopimelate ligase